MGDRQEVHCCECEDKTHSTRNSNITPHSSRARDRKKSSETPKRGKTSVQWRNHCSRSPELPSGTNGSNCTSLPDAFDAGTGVVSGSLGTLTALAAGCEFGECTEAGPA